MHRSNMDRRGTWIFGCLCTGLSAAGATLAGCRGDGGPDPREFTVLDVDGDASVSREEFARWGREHGVLDSFVSPGEKTVGETGLARGLFELWNVEGTGINEAEWTEGAGIWFPAADLGSFSSWDVDRNGILDENEMVAGFSHTNALRSFDEDGNGQIAPNELLSQFHRVFDENGDERVDSGEWASGLERWRWPL